MTDRDKPFPGRDGPRPGYVGSDSHLAWRLAADADRIAELEAEVARLRGALSEIAELPGRRWQRKTARDALRSTSPAPSDAVREAASAILSEMRDGSDTFRIAVNAMTPHVRADFDASAWLTVEETADAFRAALSALASEGERDA